MVRIQHVDARRDSAPHHREIQIVIVGRKIGHHEFALLLPETTLAHAELMAERLRRQMAENPLVAKSDRIPATVSIGVAVADETMAGIADLMKAADHALYNAKDGGRNRVISGNTRSPLVPAHLS